MILLFGVWRSSVARVVWDHEVAGSNPVTPIEKAVGRKLPTASLLLSKSQSPHNDARFLSTTSKRGPTSRTSIHFRYAD